MFYFFLNDQFGISSNLFEHKYKKQKCKKFHIINDNI